MSQKNFMADSMTNRPLILMEPSSARNSSNGKDSLKKPSSFERRTRDWSASRMSSKVRYGRYARMYSAARVSVRIVFRMRVRRPESHWQAFLEEPRHLGPSSSVIRVTASSVMGADCVFRLTSMSAARTRKTASRQAVIS